MSENVSRKLVLYGDSVGCSYKMKVRVNSYCNLLSRRLGMEYIPDYITGANSATVLQLITADEDKINHIKESEIICLSVGGNNVLMAFLCAMTRALDLGPLGARTIPSINEKFKTDKLAAVKVIKELLSKQTKDEAQAGVRTFDVEFPLILRRLRELNPSAVIIVQTVYNPFNATPSKASHELGKPMGKFMDQLNVIIQKNAEEYGFVVADIEKEFKAFDGDGEITHIKDKDMHLSDFGHAFVYRVMYDALVEKFPQYACEEQPDLFKTRLTMTAEERKSQDEADAQMSAALGEKGADDTYIQPQNFSDGPFSEYNAMFPAEADGTKLYPLKKVSVVPAGEDAAAGLNKGDPLIVKLGEDGSICLYRLDGNLFGSFVEEAIDESEKRPTLSFAIESKFPVFAKLLSVGDPSEVLYAVYPSIRYYRECVKKELAAKA